MSNSGPYDTKVGYLQEETVTAIDMPRAEFLETVAEVLDDHPDAVRAQIWPVAQTIERFPLDTWINPTRGCGCLVGEYLIASGRLDRAKIPDMNVSDHGNTVSNHSVEALLYRAHGGALARELMDFGSSIDMAIHHRLELGRFFDEPVQVVVITDEAS